MMKRLILCSTVNDDMSSRKDQRVENFTQVTAKTKAQLNIYVMVVITIYQFICKKSVKSFPSHKDAKSSTICVSVALCQTPAYTARPQIRYDSFV